VKCHAPFMYKSSRPRSYSSDVEKKENENEILVGISSLEAQVAALDRRGKVRFEA
jgi:hypothetical protein